jgi:hypothetical protein
MTTLRWSLHAACLALVLPLCASLSVAQDMRDPTVAPGTQATTPGLATAGSEGMTVLVRDGKPYLVVGTRLYAVGDKVGMMRVDRITESEVWLHDGRTLIKAPRFAGIERTAVVAKPACAPTAPVAAALSDAAPTSRKAGQQQKHRASAVPPPEPSPSPALAPCEDTQP